MVLVLLERNGTLVFGGHPAITPLMRMLFHEAGVSPREHVTLYQSGYFAEDFPHENEAFERIVIVDAVANDRERSLYEMRHRMISETAQPCAVFIGGMEGVVDEFRLFRELRPDVRLLPVASNGAAALRLYEENSIDIPELKSELMCPTLFRTVLIQPIQ